MFLKPTVLVLGAGASWHYGYPTGIDLIEEIKENITYEKFFWNYEDWPIKELLENGARPYNSLLQSLEQYEPSNIDFFLKQHVSLAEAGRHMIAMAILKRERLKEISSSNERDKKTTLYCRNGKSNWYRYLLEAIISGCEEPEDLLKNELSIVTFNYDVSLEYYLHERLTKIEFFGEKIAKEYLENLEIIHVYGSIYKPDEENLKNYGACSKDGSKRNSLYDRSKECAHNIQVIGEQKTSDLAEEKHITDARSLLFRAQNIYFLGFGFDKLNMQLLNLENTLLRSPNNSPNVFYTNYENHRRIEQRLSPLFRDTSKIDSRRKNVVASTGTVYEALEKDFDLIP